MLIGSRFLPTAVFPKRGRPAGRPYKNQVSVNWHREAIWQSAFCFSFLADSSSQTENQCRYARNAFREDSQSRARGSVQRRGPMFLCGWQGSSSGATREAIRAVHIDGPAPSGDFWFLLVASKGTRRRQGNWGDVVRTNGIDIARPYGNLRFAFRFQLTANG